VSDNKNVKSNSNNGVKPVVSLEGLSLRLSLQRERVTSLREYVIRLLKGQKTKSDEFWPLKEISLSVMPGEVVGVIGQNGAGKSTLLRVISGIIKPTSGRVEVHGRVAPLIELGAGFDSEMTGRENVFLYGAMLGFSSRGLSERLDEIISFAEVEEFIDVPLKNYSSGMVARLAFSIATDVDADILLVDEVLSVGDGSFSKKCEARMNSFREKGVSILLVSHSLDLVAGNCQRVLWIDHGHMKALGSPKEVIELYKQSLS
jgi:ABC-type polysaccharide/polyol phosphate transport system ATPase subunit